MSLKYGVAALAVLIGLGIMLTSTGTAEADFEEATVHLTPTCGCCIEHAQYLERAGVDVEVIEHSNAELTELYNEKDVPENFRACHITEVESLDTDIKGHVPLDVFNEAYEDDPEAEVVTLPGMPQGSPGMPGAQSEEWTFFSVEDGEIAGEYTTR